MPTLNRSGLVSPADALTLELALRHFVTARRAHDSIGFDVVVDALDERMGDPFAGG